MTLNIKIAFKNIKDLKSNPLIYTLVKSFNCLFCEDLINDETNCFYIFGYNKDFILSHTSCFKSSTIEYEPMAAFNKVKAVRKCAHCMKNVKTTTADFIQYNNILSTSYYVHFHTKCLSEILPALDFCIKNKKEA